MNNHELMNVEGGKGMGGLLLVLGGIVVFLIGVVDGIYRPLKCN